MLEKILFLGKKIIPKKIFLFAQPAYHYTLAFLAALWYRFPSRNIFVVVITGTKGKTTTTEIINAILEEAGFATALASTLRFKIGDESLNNTYKMTTPGRFFIQRFLRNAVEKKCDYAILEITSEAARQYRHKFISFDALVFTNLSPEHIESHGSYEKYVHAKLSIAQAVAKSSKQKTFIISNIDDKEGARFLDVPVKETFPYSLSDAKPLLLKKEGLSLTFQGVSIASRLSGEFNVYNILAGATFAQSQHISTSIIKKAIESFTGVAGRMEFINEGQDFTVIVDYAHTADSLEKVYEVFGNSKKICVLGSAGGGRDTWKRKEMGGVADRHCSEIILTNEDPYDEDPEAIVRAVAEGIIQPYSIIMNRREAIRTALSRAKTGDTVLITGKGTDPYIMGPNDTKEPWNDAETTREELRNTLGSL